MKLTITTSTLTKNRHGCWVAAKSCDVVLHPGQCLTLIEEPAVLLAERYFRRV